MSENKQINDQPIEPVDGVQLLRSYLLHCRYVRRGINRVALALNERADCHDDSKLLADEFSGFSRINKAAREHPYGSPEYRAGLMRDGDPGLPLCGGEAVTRQNRHDEQTLSRGATPDDQGALVPQTATS